ncbi:unnamed protein product [Prorocentrum cordatum]|uniref:Uncharacterized protein n=1 Tax=Prorocentrum cordatum TaxID=2364126 RepID=A0ABN9QVN2_9DINO|nr:unnamed protein product [Polarella glacialis]
MTAPPLCHGAREATRQRAAADATTKMGVAQTCGGRVISGLRRRWLAPEAASRHRHQDTKYIAAVDFNSHDCTNYEYAYMEYHSHCIGYLAGGWQPLGLHPAVAYMADAHVEDKTQAAVRGGRALPSEDCFESAMSLGWRQVPEESTKQPGAMGHHCTVHIAHNQELDISSIRASFSLFRPDHRQSGERQPVREFVDQAVAKEIAQKRMRATAAPSGPCWRRAAAGLLLTDDADASQTSLPPGTRLHGPGSAKDGITGRARISTVKSHAGVDTSDRLPARLEAQQVVANVEMLRGVGKGPTTRAARVHSAFIGAAWALLRFDDHSWLPPQRLDFVDGRLTATLARNEARGTGCKMPELPLAVFRGCYMLDPAEHGRGNSDMVAGRTYRSATESKVAMLHKIGGCDWANDRSPLNSTYIDDAPDPKDFDVACQMCGAARAAVGPTGAAAGPAGGRGALGRCALGGAGAVWLAAAAALGAAPEARVARACGGAEADEEGAPPPGGDSEEEQVRRARRRLERLVGVGSPRADEEPFWASAEVALGRDGLPPVGAVLLANPDAFAAAPEVPAACLRTEFPPPPRGAERRERAQLPVVLLTRRDEEGTFGVLLCWWTGRLLGDLRGGNFDEFMTRPLYFGGGSRLDVWSMLHSYPDLPGARQITEDGLAVSHVFEDARRWVADGPGSSLRFRFFRDQVH